MNILFVSGCIGPVTGSKLYVSGFIHFWQQRHASAVILPTVACGNITANTTWDTARRRRLLDGLGEPA